VQDENMYRYLALMADTEGLRLEPSALAGAPGIARICRAQDWLKERGLVVNMPNAAHIIWCTGGSMVSQPEMENYYRTGKSLLGD